MPMCNHDDDQPCDVGEREQVFSALYSELIRHVSELPQETRAKLLAFLHLVEDPHLVDANLHIDPAGEIHMKLFSRQNLRAKPRRAPGSDPEQLQ
jgi:hypothetical protein